ncbi:hypothetical protein [Methanosarcina sp. MSH10X1]|nr:hypothetical protein [Methanosarcina sp. MSH10X1]
MKPLTGKDRCDTVSITYDILKFVSERFDEMRWLARWIVPAEDPEHS